MKEEKKITLNEDEINLILKETFGIIDQKGIDEAHAIIKSSQEKEEKRNESDQKWFDLISAKIVGASATEIHGVLKEYEFPEKHK